MQTGRVCSSWPQRRQVLTPVYGVRPFLSLPGPPPPDGDRHFADRGELALRRRPHHQVRPLPSRQVPPRAHPSTASTGSQSGSAAPDLTLVLALGGYSIVASEVNLSQRAGCSLCFLPCTAKGGIVLGNQVGGGGLSHQSSYVCCRWRAAASIACACLALLSMMPSIL